MDELITASGLFEIRLADRVTLSGPDGVSQADLWRVAGLLAKGADLTAEETAKDLRLLGFASEFGNGGELFAYSSAWDGGKAVYPG